MERRRRIMERQARIDRQIMQMRRERQRQRRMIWLIIFNLPVKTLLRCRCLSQSLKSKIDDPQFFKTYDKYACYDYNRCRRLFLQFDHPPDADLPIPRSCPFSHRAHPSRPDLGRDVVVTGSCTGILLAAFSSFEVILWNPSTRTHRHIALPAFENRRLSCRRVSFGVGCDKDGNMKFVRVAFSLSPATREFLSEAVVYSAHTDRWQRIDFPIDLPADSFGDEPQNCEEFINSGVCKSYIIKWLVKDNPNPIQNGVRQFTIWAINLNNYDFRQELLPEIMMEGRNSISLQEIKLLPFGFVDCLVLHFGGESCEVVIWVREVGEWTKLLGVNGSFWRLKPLFYSLDKKKVLLQMDSKMMWYDLETGNYWDSNVPAVESLLYDGSLLYDATVFRDNCVPIDGLGRCPAP